MGDLNLDPITGEPGSHPIGTGVGAAGGALTGAAIGAVAGPVGAAAGAVVGAIAGATIGFIRSSCRFAWRRVFTAPRLRSMHHACRRGTRLAFEHRQSGAAGSIESAPT